MAIHELWDVDPTQLWEEQQQALAEIRTQREGGAFGTRPLLSVDRKFKRHPAEAALAFPRACVAERIRAGFHSTALRARQIDASENSWRGFPIYVIGGGARDSGLWKATAEQTPVAGKVQPLPAPGNVHGLPLNLGDRFSVAAGLAVPVALWPTTALESQVEPVPRRKVRRLPDAEERGYSKK